MQRSSVSSRARDQQILQELRRSSDDAGRGDERGKSTPQRSALTLVREFWRLLGLQRNSVLVALGLATVATGLGLIPPAATKFVIDSVLGSEPVPQWLQSWGFPAENRDRLLVMILGSVFAVSAATVLLGLTARTARSGA